MTRSTLAGVALAALAWLCTPTASRDSQLVVARPGTPKRPWTPRTPSPDKRPIGFVQFATPSFAQARYLLLHEVKRFFKPELFNRLDVVVFRSLEPMGVLAIADLFDDQLVRRLAAMRKVEVLVDEAVLDKLAADGFDPF